MMIGANQTPPGSATTSCNIPCHDQGRHFPFQNFMNYAVLECEVGVMNNPGLEEFKPRYLGMFQSGSVVHDVFAPLGLVVETHWKLLQFVDTASGMGFGRPNPRMKQECSIGRAGAAICCQHQGDSGALNHPGRVKFNGIGQ